MITYLCVYLSATFLALVITPIVIWIARHINAVDRPGIRTIHERPVPRLGGAAIFLSAISLIAAALFLDNSIGQAFREHRLQLITLLCSATFIFLIGLVDDLRGLPARCKFLAELLASGILCAVGVKISSVDITDKFVLNLGWLGWLLTILWITGITNAVNLSDGLDGLAAGISAVTCGVIAIFSIHNGDVIMAVLMLALVGSLSGFLFFNFNPAKIFMGDCGSLFLGFIIAASSVMCVAKSAALIGLALPALALGVPIFDTLFSILRRFLERRSMFAPDRRHFHHRLVDLGFRQQHVVILIYIMTLLAAGLGMFMMVAHNIGALIIFLCILLLLIFTFQVVGFVRFRETIAGIRARHVVSCEIKKETGEFENVELLFRNARRFEDWWAAICETAKRMNFAWVSLKSTTKNGSTDTSIWRAAASKPDLSEVILVTFPLPGNGDQKSHEFEIAISVNGSYESAGRRATLFSRLIDEHKLIASDRK